MKLEKYRKYRQHSRPISSFIDRNPVLYQGLALPFVVMACISLKSALLLSVAMVVTTLPVLLIKAVIQDKLPLWLTPVVYGTISMAMVLLARYVGSLVVPTVFAPVGNFFYLIALNSILIHTVCRQEKVERFQKVFVTVCWQVLGFVIVSVFVGAVRELLIRGSLLDNTIFFGRHFPAAAYPFFGFILVGLMGAALRYLHRLMLAAFIRFDQPKEERKALILHKRKEEA